jgi:hypothetical protein
MPFRVKPWADIVAFYDDLLRGGATFVEPMLALSRSVILESATEQIGGHTSMHDLVVTSLPVTAPPLDYVRVSLVPWTERVIVRHESATGHSDAIERPTADLLPVFWRFMIEKYGVHPVRDHI